MKIYTKTGDTGETSLFNDQRIKKNNQLIEAIGTIDELNSYLGTIISQLSECQEKQLLIAKQKELFILGADLANPLYQENSAKVIRVSVEMINTLEQEIDSWEGDIPKLTQFILPGGSVLSAQIFMARAISRRLERNVVSLLETKVTINPKILQYSNRLSDWFFVFARYNNYRKGKEEIYWKR